MWSGCCFPPGKHRSQVLLLHSHLQFSLEVRLRGGSPRVGTTNQSEHAGGIPLTPKQSSPGGTQTPQKEEPEARKLGASSRGNTLTREGQRGRGAQQRDPAHGLPAGSPPVLRAQHLPDRAPTRCRALRGVTPTGGATWWGTTAPRSLPLLRVWDLDPCPSVHGSVTRSRSDVSGSAGASS